jgi:arylsulfatase
MLCSKYLTFFRFAEGLDRNPMGMKSSIVCALAVCASAAALRAAPPDILLIMPDQMRGDCLSAVGHPAVRTPTFDALAHDGVLFRSGYATVPSCIPARYALLTGRSPQASGVVAFRSQKINTPTLPGVLSRVGYTTVLVGRTMHQEPPNKTVGYQREILGSTYVDNDEFDTYLKKEAPQTGGIGKVIKQTGVTFNWSAPIL